MASDRSRCRRLRSLQGMLLVGGGNILPSFYINSKVRFSDADNSRSEDAAFRTHYAAKRSDPCVFATVEGTIATMRMKVGNNRGCFETSRHSRETFQLLSNAIASASFD